MEQDSKSTKHLHNIMYGNQVRRPFGPIAIVSQQLNQNLSDDINQELFLRRSDYVSHLPSLLKQVGYYRQDYRVKVDLSRFASGEGKAIFSQSVRGHDLFIITDILNYGQEYKRFNQDISYSADDHFRDLIRIIHANHGSAVRINVILPYLYQGRTYRRVQRESLDCAQVLKQIFSLGVSNLITFDAHDSRVANAVPVNNFESFQTSLQMIEALLETVDDLRIDKDHFLVVSPDEMGISRCIYYASMMQVPLNTFYRERNYYRGSTVKEKVIKKFLGDDLHGKDVLIVDDMIDTGKTVLECARQVKARGARRVFIIATFGLFTKGIKEFNEAYAAGIIDKIFATNLSYHPPEVLAAKWYVDVNMSKYLALLIDAINHDSSLSNLLSPTDRINQLLEKYH